MKLQQQTVYRIFENNKKPAVISSKSSGLWCIVIARGLFFFDILRLKDAEAGRNNKPGTGHKKERA